MPITQRQRADAMPRSLLFDVAEKNPVTTHTGVIVRVNPGGVAYLSDEQSDLMFPFTFDLVRGYHGQPLHEAGLRPGTRVDFYCTVDGRVFQVEIKK